MQRPLLGLDMNAVPDPEGEEAKRLARRAARIARMRKIAAWLSDPLHWRRQLAQIEEGGLLKRFVRGLIYRLALLPIILMLISAGLVYLKTHPQPQSFTPDPLSVGVYYEPVILLSEDHVRLEAWLAPALDSAHVLKEKDASLRRHWPAVILAHQFGMSREQVLPFFKPFHEHGWVVMAVGLRGSGTADPAGQTFGLNEALDIKAAVDLLRRRSFVDADRIAIVGIGTGANAALLAAQKQSHLAGLVLDSPISTGEEALSELESGIDAAHWLHPLNKLAFEIGFGLDLRDLDVSRYGSTIASRPTLLTHWTSDTRGDVVPQHVAQIVRFLDHCIDQPAEAATATIQEK